MMSPSQRRRTRSLRLETLERRALLDAVTAEIARDWLNQTPIATPYSDNVALVRLVDDLAVESESGLLSIHGGVPEPAGAPDLWQVRYASNDARSAALAEFARSPSVESAAPLQKMSVTAIPNDSRFTAQWGMDNTGQSGGAVDADIDATEAWDRRTSALDVVSANIDTGVDYLHPDLYKNIWINQGEIPASRRLNLTDLDGDDLITFWDLNDPINIGAGKITDLNGNGYIDGGDLLAPMTFRNGVDSGGGWANGISDELVADPYVDDLIGWDFYNNDNDPLDDHGHGTHTAGTVGAIGNNGLGVAGVAWKTQMMVLKFMGANGSGSDLGGAKSVAYAALKGAKISNNSWGGGGSAFLRDAIIAAASVDHLFVAAAGNGNVNTDDTPFYPASYPLDNILSVTATDRNGEQLYNYGSISVDLGAPGSAILSTAKNKDGVYGYATMGGTSMATPHVTGAAVLVKAAHPTWSSAQIKSHLLATVEPMPALATKTVSGGQLNLSNINLGTASSNQAPTGLNLSSNRVAENLPAGATVGLFSSVDVNAGDTFRYTLVAGAGSTDNASFSIVGNTLSTDAQFNFENKSSYSVRVRTTDAGGLFFEKVFTISVTDVAEAPTSLTISESSIVEESPVGTVIGSLMTSDPDRGESFTYTFATGSGSADNANFTLDGSVLKSKAVFDYQTKNSYSIRVRSTDSEGLFIEQPLTIAISDVRINGFPGTTATYKENADPLAFASIGSISDVQLLNFDGGTLKVSLGATATEDDRLSLQHSPPADGKVSVNYSTGAISFTTTARGTYRVATLTGGIGTAPLVITFNANAFKREVQAVLKQLTFSNGSDNPATSPRVVSMVVTDGDGGTSNTATRTIKVTRVNDRPEIVASGWESIFKEEGPAVIIDPAITVADADSANLDRGQLTVKAVTGGQSTDRYRIIPGGPITVSGSTVSHRGVPIGAFAGASSLTVTFNANATPAMVQDLARRIAFANISGAPSAASRSIRFSLTDGDGATSLAALGDTVKMSTINDAPVLTLSNTTAATYKENGAPLLISSSATVVDVDLFDFNNGKLTVAVTSNGTSDDLLGVKSIGASANQVSVSGNTIRFTDSSLATYAVATFTGGQTGDPLVITFNANALKTEVQAVMRAVTFANDSDKPSTKMRTVTFTLTDGDGGTSNPVIRSVAVNAVNDAPTMTEFGPNASYVRNGSPVIITDSAVIKDLDSSNFNGGKLTVALTTGRSTLDRVEISSGNGITFSGSTVLYNAQIIGTFSGTTTLAVTFNSAFATSGAVQALLRQLTFRTTATTARSVVVTATLNDGDGGTSRLVSKSIKVA